MASFCCFKLYIEYKIINHIVNNIRLTQNLICILDKSKREMLRLQHFYNMFTTNYRWLIIIGSNFKLTLRLFFYPNNNNSKNLSLKICCKNVIDILFSKVKM